MTLRQQQDLLARICTDSRLREEFVRNPEKTGASFGLTAVESNEIAELSAEQLRYFSNSLISKRLHEVEKLLPRTRAALGDEFGPLFRAFSREFVPNSIKKHLEDAFEFTAWLIRKTGDAPTLTIVRRERAHLAFYGLRRRFVFILSGGRPFVFLRIGRREIVF